MVKIKLPGTYKDITIGQISAYGGKELNDVHLLRIFANLTLDEANKLPMVLVKDAVKHIKSVLAAPTQVHHPIIKVEGKDYGFIPNWEQFTAGEYIDLQELCIDVPSNATKIMSVLYRPVTRRVGDAYEIAPYEGTKGHERFRELSASYLYGALVFFSRTRNDFELSGQRSLATTLKMVKGKIGKATRKHLTKDGGGIIGLLRQWVVTLRG